MWVKMLKIGSNNDRLQKLNEALHIQSDQFEALSVKLKLQSKAFQLQSEELQLQSEEFQAQSEELRLQSEDLLMKTDALELLNHELTTQKTDEHKARLMAEQAHYLADKANLAKSTFLATMSHEIRTPINGVLGMASLLLETKLDTEQQNYTDAILNSGEYLLNVINDILDFSKIESGNLQLDNHNFELRKCIEDVLELFAAKIADTGIDLVYQIDENIPNYIIADSLRLGQVLINMVGNAIKFTSKGEVFLNVTTIIFSDHFEIYFEIRDSGIGIPESQLGNLFKAFNQLDSSTTRKYGGTGLGLVICKRLIELMGGNIMVESVVGEGTSFTFKILAEAGYNPKMLPGTEMINLCEGKNVLVVDDNITNLRIIKSQLQKLKISVKTVSSGEQALGILSSDDDIDLIITDIRMPQMDGIALCRKIKNFNKSLPIVVLSSFGDESRKKYSNLFTSILTKPVRQEYLIQVVESIFKKENAVTSITKKTNLSEEFAKEYPFEILVAEDIFMNQKLILWILNKLGYQPDLANNGKEVLDMMLTKNYDVILMDIQMPVMDGLEATKFIRQIYGPNRLIMAMTANAMMEDKEKCFEAGMDDYISKPIILKLLTKRLIALHARFKKDQIIN